MEVCVSLCLCILQIAQSDLQKIADSVNQAQDVYKQLKARREELGRAVEALKLMDEWQAWQSASCLCALSLAATPAQSLSL